ncbi:RelA/SpoT family (p)ppGpp synthetase [Rhodoligotrophos appendicifer]|uniref:RelA/SpoT family protein n=1 Tax=Rhodoligotrophos appendicifer TaxID=987056 RepID=UPI001185F2AB|nr:bifunctional (p)ppGpp synthetase/guanosine-3',5'-bis(diphosphate) 3'-pyrophosphohydrolase [Rhodoligotrophos appendicifer]
MMRQYELVEKVQSYDPDADETLLNKAYVYAMRAHGAQKRASGAPYFSHPLEVAAILTELKLDDSTIVAALLHDVVEDTGSTEKEIEELFGTDIASLVDGLTKIKKLDLATKEAAQAENLRKLLVAISQDIRVLLVKLADRLHNMRTIQHMARDKSLRIAQETMDIYAPLAGRMGMQQMREELEDLSFRVLNPDAHRTITERLTRLRDESGDILAEIEEALRAKLADHALQATVRGREKRPYAIWRKMERKHISLGQLSDIYGFRVVVEDIAACYQALGIVHQTWRAVPGRFKDYVSNPKQNDYRSLHTTVIGPHRKRVELQIRTQEMQDVAERGVAAHALYKDLGDSGTGIGSVPVDQDSNAYRWLRHLVDMLSEGVSPKEFLEHTKLELFQDQVFCFTPKGALIALPRGATPIDFAYAVHTDIGDSCVGCRINGRHAPLITELDNGDEVDVIRSKAQTPPAAWEAFAVTGKARAAIRRATKQAVRRQYAGLGREMLERTLKQANHGYDEKEIEAALPRLGFKNQTVADVLAAVGRGEISREDLLKAMRLNSGTPPTGVMSDTLKTISKAIGLPTVLGRRHSNDQNAIPVRGSDPNLPLTFAPDTGAVPGERIVGILTAGEGIIVYPIFAKALKNFDDEPERWIDLAWDSERDPEQRFPVVINVMIHNEVGALAQVTQAIGENDGNIENLQMTSQGPGFYDVRILLDVTDIKHLNKILEALRRRPLVSSVVRTTG